MAASRTCPETVQTVQTVHSVEQVSCSRRSDTLVPISLEGWHGALCGSVCLFFLKAATPTLGMGKRDSKAAKAKRAERRGKGALKTEEKTAKGEQKQKRRDANRQDDEDLEKARRSLLHLGG